jgi:hypothetical protein
MGADKPLGPLIIVKEDMFKETERLMRRKAGNKEQERSNRAAGLHDLAMGTKRRCPMRHDTIAWSGPPHDEIRAYVCLRCNAAASEPEIKYYGYEFETVPDWVIMQILDADLQRQVGGNPSSFSGLGGIV